MPAWFSSVSRPLAGIVFGAFIATLAFKPQLVKSELSIEQLEKNYDKLEPMLKEINVKLETILIDVAVLKSQRSDDGG